MRSYGDALAEEHSAAARRLIAENPAVVGIELAKDKQAVGRWRVARRYAGEWNPLQHHRFRLVGVAS